MQLLSKVREYHTSSCSEHQDWFTAENSITRGSAAPDACQLERGGACF